MYTILCIIFVFLIIYYFTSSNLVKTTTRNNKIYYTQKNNAITAAERLENIDNFIIKLKTYLLNDFKNHKLIQKKLNRNITIKEIPKNSKHVAYILNKNTLHVCLRNKNGSFIQQYNRIYFVVMHELAHMITKTQGHTKEYWNNYKLIIKTAIKYNLYTYRNYYNNPVEYCGIDINSSPYIKGGSNDNSYLALIGIGIFIFLLGVYFYISATEKNHTISVNNNIDNNVDNNDNIYNFQPFEMYHENPPTNIISVTEEIVNKDDVVFHQGYITDIWGSILKKKYNGDYVIDTYANTYNK